MTNWRILDPADLTSSSDLGDAIAATEGASISEDAERHRVHLLKFCGEHPDALHRSCTEGHVTASAAVIEEGTGRVALMLHAKVGRWLQPGGHVDGEANLAASAVREAEEETGLTGLRVVRPAIDVDVHLFDAPNEPQHLHFDVRHLVVAPQGSELIGNHESHDLGWFEESDLASIEPDPGMVRLVSRALAVAGELDLV